MNDLLDESRDDAVTVQDPWGACRLRTRTFGWADGEPEGDGTALVFLHHGLGSIAQWRGFPQALCRAVGLPGLVYERRGHGGSDPLTAPRDPRFLHVEAWQVLPRLLRAAGVRRPVLVGHSDGGSIALLHAAGPEAGRGDDPAPLAVVTIAAHVFLDAVTLHGLETAVQDWRETDLRDRLARHHGAQTEALFVAWADTWLSPGARRWNIEAELRRVRCPVLAIQGADDDHGLPAQLDSIVRHVGGPAEPWLVPGLGHSPHRQAPDRIVARIVEFLARHGLARDGGLSSAGQ
jgi:pimeloyl-ACP methyl ester carboxylesterase